MGCITYGYYSFIKNMDNEKEIVRLFDGFMSSVSPNELVASLKEMGELELLKKFLEDELEFEYCIVTDEWMKQLDEVERKYKESKQID